MTRDDLFAAALLAVGPPLSRRIDKVDYEKYSGHVQEYFKFIRAATNDEVAWHEANYLDFYVWYWSKRT